MTPSPKLNSNVNGGQHVEEDTDGVECVDRSAAGDIRRSGRRTID
jgi:hypothetical protein